MGVREMLRDGGVGVEAVENVEILRERGGHAGQIGGAAAADDENVDAVLIVQNVGGGIDRNAGFCRDGSRSAAGEDADKLRVRRGFYGEFHAFSEIAVAVNCDFHVR